MVKDKRTVMTYTVEKKGIQWAQGDMYYLLTWTETDRRAVPDNWRDGTLMRQFTNKQTDLFGFILRVTSSFIHPSTTKYQVAL